MNQRGTSTLEMIVALPFLLFVLFGIIEISRLFHDINIATAAVRDGARVGAAASTAVGAVKTLGEGRIDAILNAPGGLTSGVVERSVNCPGACNPDEQVRATVTFTFNTLIPLVGDFVSGLRALTFTQETVMRRE